MNETENICQCDGCEEPATGPTRIERDGATWEQDTCDRCRDAERWSDE